MEKILSATKLISFHRCPAEYHLGKNTVKNKAMRDGEKCHSIIERFLKGEALNDTEMQIVEGIFTDSLVSRMLTLPQQKTEEIEKSFSLEYFEPFILTGIVDHYISDGETGVVRDWKTGKRYHRNSDAATSIQGKIYALLAFQNKKDKRVFFEIVDTSHGNVVRTEYTLEDIPSLVSDILDVIEDFKECHETNTFPARPSSGCMYCDHIKICKKNAVNRVAPIPEILSKKDLEEAIQQITCTDIYIKRLREMVEAYVIANKDTDLTMKTLKAYTESKPSWRMSSSKVAKEWIASKFPNLMRPDTSAAKELILEDKDILQEAMKAEVITDASSLEVKWVSL